MSTNIDTMAPSTVADLPWLALVEDLAEDHVLVRFYNERLAGKTWKQMSPTIREKVTYAEGSKFEQRQRAAELGECLDLNGELAKMSPTQFGVWVREQRLNYQGAMDLGTRTGLSWAEIMVRAGLGQGPCRKAFEATANADSKGLRIGHGGRFADGTGEHYTGKAKRHGWIRDTKGVEALAAELRSRLLEITGDSQSAEWLQSKTVKELRSELKELGQPTQGTKAELVERLAMALSA